MKERILTTAVKSGTIGFALGFVFVAGMINKAVKETAKDFMNEEEFYDEK